MYWQYLGLPGSPASAEIDALAKWIQWAMDGIGQGVSSYNLGAVPWYGWYNPLTYLDLPTNEETIRYNLSQFWAAKDAVLAATTDEAGKRQIYHLDMLAHGCLNAVDDGLLYSMPPTYWQYWKSFLSGGTVPRTTSEITAEAKQAAADAASAARQAGLSDLGSYFDAQISSVDQIKAASDAFWSQPGILNVGGIAWYVWAALAVGAAALLSGRL